MPIFELTPVELFHNDRRANTPQGLCRVHAPDLVRLLIILAVIFCPFAALAAGALRAGDTVRTISPPNFPSRICPQPDCNQGQELARVPTETDLTIRDCRIVHQPAWDVAWYQVAFNGTRGWISEFETTSAPKERKEIWGRRLTC